jgi:hypothetical protein
VSSFGQFSCVVSGFLAALCPTSWNQLIPGDAQLIQKHVWTVKLLESQQPHLPHLVHLDSRCGGLTHHTRQTSDARGRSMSLVTALNRRPPGSAVTTGPTSPRGTTTAEILSTVSPRSSHVGHATFGQRRERPLYCCERARMSHITAPASRLAQCRHFPS